MWNLRPALPLLVVATLAAGCTSGPGTQVGDDDLTSLSARSRKLTFEGVVYVADGSTDAQITSAAETQTQTAFGALLNMKVSVQTRELAKIDPSTLTKREVTVIDTTVPADPGKKMLEVRYVYTDQAVVALALADHTSLSIAVLASGGVGHEQDVVKVCTLDDADAKDDVANGYLWYDFNPNKASCRDAIANEQKAIDAAETHLTNPQTMVSAARVARIYLPTTVSLAPQETKTGGTFPEYDKLFGGGVDPNALVIGVLDGRLTHTHVDASKDDGWPQWLATLDAVFQANPDFTFASIDSGQNIFDITVNGNHYSGFTFQDVINWSVRGSGWPKGMPPGDRDDIKLQFGKLVDMHWITFEKKVKVAIGTSPPRDFVIRLLTLFGSEDDPTPHQYLLKNSDVAIYNGHSYLGYGPLDPDNFTALSFPPSYQMFFFDSCISYNYYEEDFFTLKPGGSKVLDMVTNAIEAPEELSGQEDGRFIARLIDGSMPSYTDLLTAAKKTDSLRVVDGELDNSFDPTHTKVTLSKP